VAGYYLMAILSAHVHVHIESFLFFMCGDCINNTTQHSVQEKVPVKIFCTHLNSKGGKKKVLHVNLVFMKRGQ
jgi:hypothetical protein